MSERYQGPIKLNEQGLAIKSWHGKWFRIQNELYVSSPDEGFIPHNRIVQTLHLEEKILEALRKDLRSVDAGTFMLNNSDENGMSKYEIEIIGNSIGWHLPVPSVAGEARDISIQEWEVQSPGYTVFDAKNR